MRNLRTVLSWVGVCGPSPRFPKIHPVLEDPEFVNIPAQDRRSCCKVPTGDSSSSGAPMPPQCLSPDGLRTAMSGTSMATPHVAGAMALVLQVNPLLDAGQMRQILTDGARIDAFTGGVPNQHYGYGKLDVFSSVEGVH